MQTLSSALKAKRRKIPISLTPLIDVVFILLVFFMLASSFEKHRTVELVPPKKGKAKVIVSDDKPITVLVKGPNQYLVNEETFTLDTINGFLDRNREKKILIKTGSDAALQDVVFLLDLTGTLSLPKVSLLPYDEAKHEKP